MILTISASSWRSLRLSLSGCADERPGYDISGDWAVDQYCVATDALSGWRVTFAVSGVDGRFRRAQQFTPCTEFNIAVDPGRGAVGVPQRSGD